MKNIIPTPSTWKNQLVNDHIRDFPISTAHDIIDRLSLELDLNGGFSTLREERIRELDRTITLLIAHIDAKKGEL